MGAEPLERLAGGGLEAGTVTGREPDGTVTLEGGERARVALVGYAPEPGDRVLSGRAGDDLYVVGVVRALRAVESRAVTASDGVRAALETDDEAREVLRLRDPQGELLLEHRPHDGRTVICAAGDLAIDAGGDLALGARGDVRVSAGGALLLEGAGDVGLRATDLDGEARSAFSMREGRAALFAERLGAEVERADVSVQELNLVARTLRTVADRVRTKAERVEVEAGRVMERARESWRETEGLAQTTAGRLRLVARGALTALGREATLRGRADVKIKGEKIYLA